MAKRINTVDCAKLIRKELKKKFPTQKFSVRSSIYSGGSSIDVKWKDGVSTESVKKIVKRFEGAGFDPYQDMKIYHPATEYKGDKVSFGVDFVFPKREYSPEKVVNFANETLKKFGIRERVKTITELNKSKVRIGNDWLSNYVYLKLAKKTL